MQRDHDPRGGKPRRPSLEQKFLAVLIVSVAISIAGYRWLVFGGLEQTSALFIGLPGAVAAALALLPTSRSATLAALNGATILLLVSGMFLGEGFLCILMAAPIFYAVAGAIGLLVDVSRARAKRRRPAQMLLLAPFALMSLEGVAPELSFPREESVSVERVLEARPEEVASALAQSPRLDRPLPAYFRLGFPRPESVAGGGSALGDACRVHLAGGEGAPGELSLEVIRSEPGLVEWRFVGDTTHVAHWTGLERARVEWSELGPGRTRVRWTIDYERRLDPAWYFGPMQRYAARLAGGYLIECMATPRAE